MSIKSATKRVACIFAASLILTVGSVEVGLIDGNDIFDAISITAEATSYKYTYYPKCASKYTSFVDALKSIKISSTMTNRKAIAKLNDISNYTGTASQNTKLLNLLKNGKLVKTKTAISESSTVTYYPKCASKYTSFIDALKSIKVSSTMTNRKAIAKLNGISNYTSTASQNKTLLSLLKNGKLVKSKGSKPTTTSPTTGTDNSNKSIITNSSYNVSVTNKAKENQPHYENVTGKRSASAYNTVINQFNVETNKRYKRTSNATYCNIFGWDVMSAMNVDLPHWVKNNKPATSNTSGATEMNANATYNWMLNYGVKNYGWKEISAKEAQNRANKGYPTVAIYKNPSGKSGHIMVVRPEKSSYKYSASKGPVIAQAGSSNYNYGHPSSSILNAKTMKYFTHN